MHPAPPQQRADRDHEQEVNDQERPEENEVYRGQAGRHKGHIDEPGALQRQYDGNYRKQECPVLFIEEAIGADQKNDPADDAQIGHSGMNVFQQDFTARFC